MKTSSLSLATASEMPTMPDPNDIDILPPAVGSGVGGDQEGGSSSSYGVGAEEGSEEGAAVGGTTGAAVGLSGTSGAGVGMKAVGRGVGAGDG